MLSVYFTLKIIDVHCKDIQKHPAGIFKNICKQLKININDKSNGALDKWVKKKKNDAPGKHNFSFPTYGVSKSLVENKFRFYDDKRYLLN